MSPGATTAAGRLIWPSAVEDPAAGGDQHQEERPQQLGEQPPPLEARIVEVLAVPELEREQVPRPGVVLVKRACGFAAGRFD